MLEDVRVNGVSSGCFWGLKSRVSATGPQHFFTWGICIDGSLPIMLMILLPPSGDDDPM